MTPLFHRPVIQLHDAPMDCGTAAQSFTDLSFSSTTLDGLQHSCAELHRPATQLHNTPMNCSTAAQSFTDLPLSSTILQ